MTTTLAEETPAGVVASYPLSALQAGMLFHHLLAARPGVDVVQIVCSLEQPLDEDVWRRAWDAVARRHDALRTALRWLGCERPQQDVFAAVEIPVRSEDLRTLSPEVRAARVHDFLLADRQAGFALDVAPLFRLALFRTGETTYEFVWTMHHAALDGRSYLVVLRDVAAAYDALLSGREPGFGPTVQFGAFVAWLERRDHTAAETFWRERLRGRVAPTPLPAGFPGSACEPDERGTGDACALSPEATAALERLAAAAGCRGTTLVQAAWALLLARHAGETDVVFGVTRAARRDTIPGAEDVAGSFINTLPLRVTVSPDASLGAWLRSLGDAWHELRDVEQTPLARVQGWSDTPAGTPLFDSLVVYEAGTLAAALEAADGPFAGARFTLLGQTNYALTLEAFGGERLRLKLQYDPARYAPADVARLLGHLQTVLEGMAAARPATRLGEIPWLTSTERRAAVDGWNRTATGYPRDASIPAVFANRAAATPEAVAVTQGDRSLTYRELDEYANRIARRLQRLGVGPEVPVGLCAARSVDSIAAMLGILKAGGAYVPLDPAYPAERLRFLAADTALDVLLAEGSLAVRLPPARHVVALAPAAFEDEEASAPTCAAAAQSAACIIYTSGSTGSPKGVVVTHRGVVRLVVGATYVRLGPGETVLSFAPPTFDAATFEIWGPLLNGGKLVLFPAVEPTLEALATAIRDGGVTTLWLTAGLFHQMVDRRLEGLQPLRQLLAGGDVLSPSHVRRVLRELPDCRLVNGYGPTENTTFTTCYAVPTGFDSAATSVPIGVPISNTTAYVLDDARAPVPVGVAGRLYAGGDGVARGYHARPQLTAQRFVPDPFSRRPGARMYDTGDRARRLPDGTLEFLGRADDQVKIRGFRVEPGEVEAALLTHPGVRGALALARPDGEGAKRLAAYVVFEPERAIDGETVRTYLAARLPAYLVPASIAVLDAFPLTANGKVDRDRLPDPLAEVARRRAPFVAPRTPAETALAAVWAAILGVERVGVLDDFFELGGDSLLTIALVSRARDAGLRIAPRQLYDRPTVAGLAAVAVAIDGPSGALAASAPAAGPAPLTPVQRWFFEGEPAARNYWNQTFLFELAPGVEEAHVRAAVGELLVRHDALRTRFVPVSGGWEQHVAAAGAVVPFERIALGALRAEELPPAIEAACVRVQSSLDVERGPLLRAALLDLGAGRPGRLLLAVHHLVVDAVSWRLLLEDLDVVLTAAARGVRPALPAATTSYRRWAERLDAAATAPAFEAGRSYWHGVAAETRTALPGDAPRLPETEGAARTLTVALEPAATEALLQRVPPAARARVEEVLVAALGLALRPWVPGDALRIELEGHGREDVFENVDLSRTVGWFTSVFPFVLELAPGTPAVALRAVKERLRAVPLRGLGYGVLRYLARDPVLAAASQPELVFNYLGRFDAALAGTQRLRFADESSGPWRGPSSRRRYALEVNALVAGGRLEVRWTYGSAHRRETVERLAAEYLAAVRATIAACLAPDARTLTPSDFPLARLDPATLDRLVAGVPDLDDAYPLSPIQTLFAAFPPGDADPGYEQWRYRLRGDVDPVRLRAAWQAALDRHSILRTGFVVDGSGDPVQFVRRHVTLPWLQHDWCELAPAERGRRYDELLRDDRVRGFERDAPPLMRLALVRLAEREYDLVWSLHHLLLDRWSWPLVLRDVGRHYTAAGDERARRSAGAPGPAAPYRDYIAWLAGRDSSEAERFWREAFAGFEAPPSFAPAGAAREGPLVTPVYEAALALKVAETAAVRGFARSARLSPNVVVLGAWALWLAHGLGTADLAVGLAVSGRPAELPGIEELVGVTIDNLPVRVRFDPAEPVAAYLARLATAQADVQQYGFVPPGRVQEWSGVPWRRRLFETLVVFQAAAAVTQTQAWLGPAIAIDVVSSPTRTEYPLSLVVSGVDRFEFRLAYDPRCFTRAEIAEALGEFRTVLLALARDSARPVSRVLAALPPATRGRRACDVAPAASPHVFVAPRSALEAVVAGIWGDLLERPRVGANDDFFQLGGQSLLAMQAVSRLRDVGLALPVRELFAAPTVAGIAAALERLEPRPGYARRVAELVREVEAMSLDELRAAGGDTGG